MAPSTDDTQDRLLEAARHVFAEKGVERATVREILKRAGVKNIAAINYYFGDKERLYIETIKHAHRTTCMTRENLPRWAADTPPAQKLRDFIHTFVRRMMDAEDPVATQLMMREMTHPTQACEELVRDNIRPVAMFLQGILAELMPQESEAKQMMAAFSIVSQIIFYRQNQAVIRLLAANRPEFKEITAELLADHIASFSLAALGSSLTPQAEEVHP